MLFKAGGGVLLLQAAALISGAAARCVRTCPADDPLLKLLRSESDESSDFCRDFLGLPVAAVETIVTPTVVATVTETNHVAAVVTEVDTTLTVTVTASAASTTAVNAPQKRGNAYPTWLPVSYGTNHISKACSCLSLEPAVSTMTLTVDAVTVTDPATVTETTTVTVHTTVVATETAKPAPKPVRRVIKIGAVRKNAGTSLGYIYNSNGPALTSNVASATTFDFNLLDDKTSGSQLRLGSPHGALGFNKDSNPSNIVELEDYYGSLKFVAPTEPGSIPQTVDDGKNKYESDIWAVDTETREITWHWIARSGALPNIMLYYVSGRLYPVGNLERFMYSTSSTIGERVEVKLRYTMVEETVL